MDTRKPPHHIGAAACAQSFSTYDVMTFRMLGASIKESYAGVPLPPCAALRNAVQIDSVVAASPPTAV